MNPVGNAGRKDGAVSKPRLPKSKSPATSATAVERFSAETDAERDAEVARFDHPFEVQPLTAEMKKKWEDSRIRRRGRQKIGLGAEKVMMSIERGLLKAADQMAAAEGLKRSELVSAALRWALEAVVTVVRAEDGTAFLVPEKIGKPKT